MPRKRKTWTDERYVQHYKLRLQNLLLEQDELRHRMEQNALKISELQHKLQFIEDSKKDH